MQNKGFLNLLLQSDEKSSEFIQIEKHEFGCVFSIRPILV